jgi:phage terminase Nu1 subunit (DNA packaging protein)
MEQVKERPDIIEMAKKKRHLYLLEKLKNETTLSKPEITELEKLEKKLTSGCVNTQEEVANLFGVNVRTVRRWADQGMPKTSKGHYNIAEIQEWRFCKGKGKTKKLDPKEANWENIYRRYKALLAELEWKERTKQLVPVAEVEKNNINKILAIKTRLLALPNTVAPQVVGLETKEIAEILRKRVEEILDAFATGKVTYVKVKKKSK